MNNMEAVTEGILYVVGDDGITVIQLAETLEISEEETQQLLDKMMLEYTENETRGIEMVNYGGRYKLVSKAISHPYCQKLFERTETRPFSQAALETLAIIAYKQPITRVEIEEIRGVSCDMMIRKLLARNLIREAGRLEVAGRPFTYEVTEQFMDTFKLKSLDELPELPEYGNSREDEELFG
ncbi:MAG: SMC-Scp complex subunit ScpB [Erysipelotrichaceae bacterium]|nr:SMC-Scp complex subunit ScpB [Erysipelotrichaceae bacterium]MBR2792786.1 SMC-Scp complex subunit ScpB [Erysipelotrichaceae bacterium]